MEPSDTDTAMKVMLRRIHLVATVWFVACVGYLVSVGLRQAGYNGWLVFSLSGYSTSMLLLLVCLYLFAFVHGMRGARRCETEHPLTGAACYMVFYVSTPLLAGLCAAAGAEAPFGTSTHLIHVATATLKATFIAWIVVDPLVGLMEMDLPASRSHRTERVARMKNYDRCNGGTTPRDCSP